MVTRKSVNSGTCISLAAPFAVQPILLSGRHSPRLYSLLRRNPLLEVAKSILLILSALFPIVNPLGGSPVFLALTHEYPASARRILARSVAVNSFFLLIASFLIGSHILNFFGISIPVVQVGGGLIVISNGWAMLKSKEEVDRGRDVQKKVNLLDISRSAFYPLTLPLTVGPGSISMAITFGAHQPRPPRPNPLAPLRAGVAPAPRAPRLLPFLHFPALP